MTSIGEGAFERCSNLMNVTIPDSVTRIGDRAFESCASLMSVTISNSVTSIGDRAFFGCACLTSVIIPDSVTSVEEYAFYGCNSLTNVTFVNPNNWTAGTTSISSTDLSNPTTAAIYLTSSYCGYDWSRTEVTE